MKTFLFNDISIKVTADSVAWYAAIIATFSAIKVVYDILSDRRKIQLSYGTDVRIQGAGYDPNENQFCIEVVNTGKRIVKVVNVGYFKRDGSKGIFSDSLFNLQDRILTESNPSTSYLVPLKDVEVSNLWYLFALDGRGKVYKKYLYKFARLRHISVFFIRRKNKKKIKK
jgi:hypothetical protein